MQSLVPLLELDTVIGSSAAILTTSSFIPQIIKAYRTKRMKDVSTYLMSLFSTGTVLWMFYGIMKDDLVIIIANATATSFNLILLYLKLAYRERRYGSRHQNQTPPKSS